MRLPGARTGRVVSAAATVVSAWALASCGREPLPPVATTAHGSAIVTQTAYAPSPALATLLAARLRKADARLVDPPASSAAQLSALRPLLARKGGLSTVVVGAFDPPAVERLLASKGARPRVVSVLNPLRGAEATITLDQQAVARRLAQAARRWAATHGGVRRATVIGPPAQNVLPDWSVPAGRGMATAIADALGQQGFSVDRTAALGTADAAAALEGSARVAGGRTVIVGWNDLTALGAVEAAPRGSFIAAAGAPAPTSTDTLDALRERRLDLLVGTRLSDLADAIVHASGASGVSGGSGSTGASAQSGANDVWLPVEQFSAREPRALRAARADYAGEQ